MVAITFSRTLILLALVGVSADSQGPIPDYSGDFNFNVDLYLNYSSDLYDIGTAVAIWSDYAAASATHMLQNDGTYDPYGIIFLFKRNPAPTSMFNLWLDTGLFLTSDVREDDYGQCISMSSEVIAVGAPSHSQSGKKTGAAYIHFDDNFQSTVSLFPSSAEEYSYFGASVAVTPGASHYTGGAVLVGAYGHYHDGSHPNSGMVYVYSKNYNTYMGYTWSQTSKLQPSIIYPNSQFGKALSSYGNILAVGSPGIDKVFIFNLENHEEHEQREQQREEERNRDQEEYEHHMSEEERQSEEAEREQEELEREQEREREEDNRDYDRQHERNDEHHHNWRRSRALQEDRDRDHEREDREREERERHEDEDKDHSEWGYYEVLVVTSNQNTEHKGPDEPEPEHKRLLEFGCTVSVTNDTVLSVAIGASDDGLTTATGGAYVISMARKQDVYSDFHSNHRKLRDTRYYDDDYYSYSYGSNARDGSYGGSYGGNNYYDSPDYTFTPLWNLYSDQYNLDYEGNFWALEFAAYGTDNDERFGSSVSISGGVVAVGGAGSLYTGKVDIYARVACNSGCDYFFKDIILRGPMYNSQWVSTSTIYDSDAAEQNTFGSAVSLNGDTVIIGSKLMNYGAGSAYIYSTRTIVFSKVDDGDDAIDWPERSPDTGNGDGSGNDNDSGSGGSSIDSTNSSGGGSVWSGDRYGDGRSDSLVTDDTDGGSFSLAPLLKWKYWGRMVLGVIVVAAVVGVYARIRYHFTKPQKKKKKGKKGSGGVNSLNDLDSSTTSRHGLLDTSTSSVGSSVHSHVQMAPYSGQLAPPPPPPPRPHERGRAGGGRGGRGPLTHPSRQMLPQAQRPRGGQPPPPGMHPGSSHGLQHGYAAQDRAEYYDNSQPYHHEQRHPSMHGDGMGGSRSGKSQRLSQGGRLSSSQHGAAMYSS